MGVNGIPVSEEIQGNLAIRDFSGTGLHGNLTVERNLTVGGALSGAIAVAPSGDPSGATDTARINGLLNLGALVQLTPGQVYSTNAPLVIPTGQAGLICAGRGLGIPSGNFGGGGLPLLGAIIQPAAGFAGTTVISIAGSTVSQFGGQMLDGITIDGSLLPAGNTVNGITGLGWVAAVTLHRVLVWGGYAGTTGLGGIGLDIEGISGKNPDFWDISHVKVSACKGIGIKTVALSDTTWLVVEATGNNGDNWNISNGNNSRYVLVKGENSSTGWDFNVIGLTGFTGYLEFIIASAAGGSLGAIQVSGAGTGTFYFADTHTTGGTVTITGTNTVKTTAAWTAGSITTS
jgi:hypothetical protein